MKSSADEIAAAMVDALKMSRKAGWGMGSVSLEHVIAELAKARSCAEVEAVNQKYVASGKLADKTDQGMMAVADRKRELGCK